MWQLYLFSACHTDLSFKLPLEKSIKHVQILKEVFRVVIVSNCCEFTLENNEIHLEVLIWDFSDLMIAVVNYCQG